MPFQSTVEYTQGFGIPGDIFNDSPKRVDSWNIVSVDAAYNVMGRAFTKTSENVAAAGNGVGGTTNSVFAGILVGPKEQANYGTSAGTLAPTLTIANNQVGELATMGDIIVNVGGAASIGDLVSYNTTTGALGTYALKASFTGVIAVTTGVLTVSALAAGGYIAPGEVISGTGVPAGTVITGQITGTTGSNGTYQTNITTAVSSTAMTVPNSPLATGAGYAQVPTARVWEYDIGANGLGVIKLTN